MGFKNFALVGPIVVLMMPAIGIGADHVVEMRDNSFFKKNLQIMAGDRVKWENVGDTKHTATSNSSSGPNAFNTHDVLSGNESGWFTFNTAGTIPYSCIYHKNMGMVGTIQVNASLSVCCKATSCAKRRCCKNIRSHSRCCRACCRR